MSNEKTTNRKDTENGHKKFKDSNDSQIPILSPTHFKRVGSLKLRNELRMPHKPEASSTPTPPLRRHRSLVNLLIK